MKDASLLRPSVQTTFGSQVVHILLAIMQLLRALIFLLLIGVEGGEWSSLKEREHTRGLFSNLGYMVPSVGYVVFEIPLGLESLYRALDEVEKHREMFDKERLDDLDHLRSVLNSIVEAVDHHGHREKRGLGLFATGVSVVGLFGAGLGSLVSGWLGYDDLRVAVEKNNEDVVDVVEDVQEAENRTNRAMQEFQKSLDANTAEIFASRVQARVYRIQDTVEAAYQGFLKGGYLNYTELRNVFNTGKKKAGDLGYDIYAQQPQDVLLTAETAMLSVDGKPTIGLRMPIVRKERAIMHLYYIRDGLIHMEPGHAMRHVHTTNRYFAINHDTGEHAFFGEDQYKGCRPVGPRASSFLMCDSVQLFQKSHVESCAMAMWKDDYRAMRRLCNKRQEFAHMESRWVKTNSLLFTNGAETNQTCTNLTASSDVALITETVVDPYEIVEVPVACVLETKDAKFWASFTIQAEDEIEGGLQSTMSLAEAQDRKMKAQRHLQALKKLKVLSPDFIANVKSNVEGLAEGPMARLSSWFNGLLGNVQGFLFLVFLLLLGIVGLFVFFLFFLKRLGGELAEHLFDPEITRKKIEPHPTTVVLPPRYEDLPRRRHREGPVMRPYYERKKGDGLYPPLPPTPPLPSAPMQD